MSFQDNADWEEIERKLELLREFCARAQETEVEAIAEVSDQVEPPTILERHIVLYGFEGQVDAVVYADPPPSVYFLPVRQKFTLASLRLPPNPPLMRIASYRRVGPTTYERYD